MFSAVWPMAENVSLVRASRTSCWFTTDLVQSIGNFQSIAGIDLAEFNAMSGGFHYFEGGPFQPRRHLMVDTTYARTKHLHVGATSLLARQSWHICAWSNPGKLSPAIRTTRIVQDIYSKPPAISVI